MLALGYSAGVGAGAILGGPWLLTATLAGLLSVAAILRGERRLWLIVAVATLAGAGHARIAARDQVPPPPLASVAGTHVVIGVVRDDAVFSGMTARVDLDVETVDGSPLAGGIRARLITDGGTGIRAGDRLRVTARLDAPDPVEALDYVAFLRDRDIYLLGAMTADWERAGAADLGWRGRLLDLRRNLVARLERTLPEPAAALAAGVLVGARGTMPDDLAEALRATGTTHLVVVSGQNVALILGLAVAALTAMMSRRRAALLTLGILPAYVVFVGADPPVVRAALMAVAVVAANVTGRRTPGWIYLAYAIALMLAVEPRLIRDVAFQLSGSATAGIVLLAPVLSAAVLARWPALASPGRTSMVTVAATATAAAVAVLPVQVAAFEVVAPWTVLANIVVAPLYEATLVTAALAALLGGGGPIGEILTLVPNAFIALVELLARLPASQVPLRLPLVAAVVFIALLMAAAAAAQAWTVRREAEEPREGVALDRSGSTGLATSVGLAVVAVGLWWTALAPAEAHVTMTVLDVGQGLAVLVRDGDASVLIDTGPPDGAIIAALGAAGARGRLDAVIVSHTDADHVGGLASIARRFEVGAVYMEPTVLRPLAADISPLALDIGDRVAFGRVTIEVLAPPVATRSSRLESDNNGALVLLVTVGERRMLVTSDIEAEAEEWLVTSGLDLRADVLVVPHHGSRTSSTPSFLAEVEPLVAVIPVGRNSYGQPHLEVVERYASIDGLELRRTDEDGTVTVRTDGDRLWVATER